MMEHHIAEPLDDGRYKALILLAIPSAVLSIAGSTAIIYMVCSKKTRRWTPYTRLLLCMSICDIILSVHLAMGSFMRPEATSNRPWAVGNEATCAFSGWVGQLSLSANLYNAALSFYFLFSARFRMKDGTIARWVEPFMHTVAIGYPLATATIGAFFGFFSEPELGLGCGVNDYPRNCGEGPGKTGEICLSIVSEKFYML